jgi:hypothetical protein
MLASGAACPAIWCFEIERSSSFKFHYSLHFAFVQHESRTIDVTQYVGYAPQTVFIVPLKSAADDQGWPSPICY